MTQEPKKHHYLPEFYTWAWCGPDGQLIRYVNRNGAVHTRPFTPGQVGYRKDLYRLVSATISDRTAIERHHFEKLDNAAAPIFERMNHEARLDLSESDRIAVAEFVVSLPARNPWGIARGQDIAREVFGQQLTDPEDAKVIGLPPTRTILTEIETQNPHYLVDSSLITMIEASTAPELIARIVRYHWAIWDITGSPFDLVFGDRVFAAHGNLTEDRRENLIAIPVGPKRLLTCTAAPYRGGGLSPREIAAVMNREQASRAAEHIFAKDRSHVPLARKHLRHIGTWKWPGRP